MGGGVTVGQAAGAVVGGVVGFFAGGPAGALYGASLGYGIGGMIDPPKTPGQDIDTQDLSFNTFQRNLPVPIVYGRNKVPGNIIWIGNTRSKTHKESGGGKGGGGGGASKWVEYFADFAVGIAEGEIVDIVNVYVDDADVTANEGDSWVGYVGSTTQVVNSNVQSAIPTNPPLWRNTAYLLFTGSLGQMNRLPTLSAIIHGIDSEIVGDVSIGGSWEDYLATPYTGTESHFYPNPNADGTELLAVWFNRTSQWTKYYKWTKASQQWTYLGQRNGFSVLNEMDGRNLCRAIYWKGQWWHGSFRDSPFYCFLTYTSDFITFNDYSTPSLQYTKIQFVAPSLNDSTLFFGGGNNSTAKWEIWETPFPVSPTLRYQTPSTYTMLGASVVKYDNNNSYRIVVFTKTGSSYYIAISNENDPTAFTYYDFTLYGSFTLGGGGWTIPVKYTEEDRFYFCALNSGDSDKTYLYACTFDGTITIHTKVTDTVISIYKTIGGMFSWNGYLWISSHEWDAALSQWSHICGYWASQTDEMVWLDTPVFTYRYSGLGSLTHDDEYLRLIQADFSGGGVNRDVRLSVGPLVINNSPPTSVWDFLTNTRYGMGIPEEKLDIDSFIAAHNYCIEEISAGDLRYTLDIVLGSSKSALDHLVMMLQSFGGFLVWSEGVIKLKVEKSESSTASLTEDTIIADSFQYTVPSLKDVPNRVNVDFRDREDDFRHRILTANDEYNQDDTSEIRSLDVQLHGVTRETQAARLAQFYLDSAISNQIILIFRVSIQNIAFEVGDVIDITHSLPGWTGKLFRIMEISEEENDEMLVTCREYNANIYHDEPAASQGNTDSYIPSSFAPPEHVVHLDAYEKPEAPEIRVTFSLPTNPGWWAAAQIYKSVGDNLNYEHVGDSLDISDAGLVESSITATASILYVKSIYGSFPASGTLIVDDEEMAYSTFTDDGDGTGYFSGLTRGQNNTSAAPHLVDVVITLKAGSFIYGFDTVNELYQRLYFKAVSVSPRGVAATPLAYAPETSVDVVGRYKRMPPVGSLQINGQGNYKVLPDSVDCVISWRGRNRYVGYGKMKYGAYEGGYGGGGNEDGFQYYRIDILSSGGSTLRIARTTDESWTYSSAMRTVDGTDTGADFTINARQKSSWALSEGVTLVVNS